MILAVRSSFSTGCYKLIRYLQYLTLYWYTGKSPVGEIHSSAWADCSRKLKTWSSLEVQIHTSYRATMKHLPWNTGIHLLQRVLCSKTFRKSSIISISLHHFWNTFRRLLNYSSKIDKIKRNVECLVEKTGNFNKRPLLWLQVVSPIIYAKQ